MNQLNDEGIIADLYRASRAGVEVDLIVRGHCRLRPGLQSYSENIRVISILGRFLEHTRIYYFGNEGASEVYIGSADWMSRNLNDRVEAIVEVKDERHKERLTDLLDRALADQRSAWDLHADGHYVQRAPSSTDEQGFQQKLMAKAAQQ
jgi:polyphosphate kinase